LGAKIEEVPQEVLFGTYSTACPLAQQAHEAVTPVNPLPARPDLLLRSPVNPLPRPSPRPHRRPRRRVEAATQHLGDHHPRRVLPLHLLVRAQPRRRVLYVGSSSQKQGADPAGDRASRRRLRISTPPAAHLAAPAHHRTGRASPRRHEGSRRRRPQSCVRHGRQRRRHEGSLLPVGHPSPPVRHG